MGSMDWLLLNPWVSRAGNATFLVGVVVFVVRLVRGWDPLTILVAVLLGVGVLLMAVPVVARRRPRTPKSDKTSEVQGDLSVEIEHEEWDNFKHKARILEIRVKVTNHTDRRKRMASFAVLIHGGPNTYPSSTGNTDLFREVERRKGNHPLLQGISIIEPRDFAKGWMVFPFPWSTDAGPSGYSFMVRDELNVDYVARGGSALPLPQADAG